MSNIDWSSLDGRSLLVFLAVLEEESVTQAARRLQVTQSAVSHTLEKLRMALHDPLFVRAGRGIVATERARSLREPVQGVLDSMRQLTDERVFDPHDESMDFTIAANDFQRDLFFPQLARECAEESIDIRFRFLPSNVPGSSLLSEGRCQLMVTPFPPDAGDIVTGLLFRDHMACFFDPDVRKAPKTQEEFLRSEFVEVRFADHTSALSALSDVVRPSERKEPRVTVPNFSALGPFMKGTSLITTQLSAMKLASLSSFACAPFPFHHPALTLSMAWHRREHANPAHAWLRKRLYAAAERIKERLPAD